MRVLSPRLVYLVDHALHTATRLKVPPADACSRFGFAFDFSFCSVAWTTAAHGLRGYTRTPTLRYTLLYRYTYASHAFHVTLHCPLRVYLPDTRLSCRLDACCLRFTHHTTRGSRYTARCTRGLLRYSFTLRFRHKPRHAFGFLPVDHTFHTFTTFCLVYLPPFGFPRLHTHTPLRTRYHTVYTGFLPVTCLYCAYRMVLDRTPPPHTDRTAHHRFLTAPHAQFVHRVCLRHGRYGFSCVHATTFYTAHLFWNRGLLPFLQLLRSHHTPAVSTTALLGCMPAFAFSVYTTTFLASAGYICRHTYAPLLLVSGLPLPLVRIPTGLPHTRALLRTVLRFFPLGLPRFSFCRALLRLWTLRTTDLTPSVACIFAELCTRATPFHRTGPGSAHRRFYAATHLRLLGLPFRHAFHTHGLVLPQSLRVWFYGWFLRNTAAHVHALFGSDWTGSWFTVPFYFLHFWFATLPLCSLILLVWFAAFPFLLFLCGSCTTATPVTHVCRARFVHTFHVPAFTVRLPPFCTFYCSWTCPVLVYAHLFATHLPTTTGRHTLHLVAFGYFAHHAVSITHALPRFVPLLRAFTPHACAVCRFLSRWVSRTTGFTPVTYTTAAGLVYHYAITCTRFACPTFWFAFVSLLDAFLALVATRCLPHAFSGHYLFAHGLPHYTVHTHATFTPLYRRAGWTHLRYTAGPSRLPFTHRCATTARATPHTFCRATAALTATHHFTCRRACYVATHLDTSASLVPGFAPRFTTRTRLHSGRQDTHTARFTGFAAFQLPRHAWVVPERTDVTAFHLRHVHSRIYTHHRIYLPFWFFSLPVCRISPAAYGYGSFTLRFTTTHLGLPVYLSFWHLHRTATTAAARPGFTPPAPPPDYTVCTFWFRLVWRRLLDFQHAVPHLFALYTAIFTLWVCTHLHTLPHLPPFLRPFTIRAFCFHRCYIVHGSSTSPTGYTLRLHVSPPVLRLHTFSPRTYAFRLLTHHARIRGFWTHTRSHAYVCGLRFLPVPVRTATLFGTHFTFTGSLLPFTRTRAGCARLFHYPLPAHGSRLLPFSRIALVTPAGCHYTPGYRLVRTPTNVVLHVALYRLHLLVPFTILPRLPLNTCAHVDTLVCLRLHLRFTRCHADIRHALRWLALLPHYGFPAACVYVIRSRDTTIVLPVSDTFAYATPHRCQPHVHYHHTGLPSGFFPFLPPRLWFDFVYTLLHYGCHIWTPGCLISACGLYRTFALRLPHVAFGHRLPHGSR